MNNDDPRLIQIRSNAALVIAELGQESQQPFGYDEASIDLADRYLEFARTNPADSPDPERLVTLLGSYVGEAIAKATGAEWAVHERDEIGLKFPSGDWCFPFSKAAKQFAHGAETGESIAGFYRLAIGYVAEGKLTGAAQSPENS